MENIVFSANVILPLLCLILVGYIVRRLGLIDQKTTTGGNTLVFHVFLPVLLFNNVRNCSIEDIMNIPYFFYIFICTVTLFIVVSGVIVCIEKDNAKRGVMIQGICRSNYALFGIPLISLLYPNENIALASVLLAILIPIFNIASVIILTIANAQRVEFRKILIAILKNPLIIGTVLGIIFMVYQLELPYFIDVTCTNLGSIATPFALFILGAGFEFQKVQEVKKQLGIVVIGRLILVPLMMVSLAYIVGYRGLELTCIMVAYSAPTAVSSYPMAERMGGSKELASAIVVFTSIISIFSIFVIIYILKAAGLL